MAGRRDSWDFLLECDADVALLQEAVTPPDGVAGRIEVDRASFLDARGHRVSRATVVKLSDEPGVQVKLLEPVPIGEAKAGDFVVSHPRSIAAAIVTAPGVERFVAASICAAYEKPHRWAGKALNIVDASVHRIISDLSLMIGRPRRHRIVAAGDLTIWHGFGPDEYWKRRYDTVFDRMAAIGLPFVGPQYPHGWLADPWPSFLPEDSLNVPTYYNIGASPAEANNQLDFVFASEGMAKPVQVRALNGVEEWGPSDHCRLEIEVG